MKTKNFVQITIPCQSAEEMLQAKQAVLYHLETLNPEFEANGNTLTVTVVPLDPKLFQPEEAYSIIRQTLAQSLTLTTSSSLLHHLYSLRTACFLPMADVFSSVQNANLIRKQIANSPMDLTRRSRSG